MWRGAMRRGGGGQIIVRTATTIATKTGGGGNTQTGATGNPLAPTGALRRATTRLRMTTPQLGIRTAGGQHALDHTILLEQLLYRSPTDHRGGITGCPTVLLAIHGCARVCCKDLGTVDAFYSICSEMSLVNLQVHSCTFVSQQLRVLPNEHDAVIAHAGTAGAMTWGHDTAPCHRLAMVTAAEGAVTSGRSAAALRPTETAGVVVLRLTGGARTPRQSPQWIKG